MSEMMRIDAAGGAGKDSVENRERLRYDNRHMEQGDEPPGATAPASGRPPRGDVQPQGMKPDAVTPKVREPASPHGHSMPGMNHESVAPAQETH